MTAQTGPTMSPDATPPPADPYAASDAHAAVHAAAQELASATFGEALLEVQTFRGETTLVVAREQIREILTILRQDEQTRLDRISNLTAVDYID